MAQVPRIRRVEPTGPITQPYDGIPVAVRLVWHDGATTSVDAHAVGVDDERGRDRVDHAMERHPARLDPRRPGEPSVAGRRLTRNR